MNEIITSTLPSHTEIITILEKMIEENQDITARAVARKENEP